MFETVDGIIQIIRDPFMNAAESVQSFPMLYAFALGIVGALAPCQLSGNITAMTLYGSNSIRKGISWLDTVQFLAGKAAAFSLLGLIVFLLGQEFQRQLPLFFEPFRWMIGPLLIAIGLFLAGFLPLNFRIPYRFEKKSRRGGGAFLLGFTFSLAFCPTMFILFFVLMMPAAVASPAGAIMPALFAAGTTLPFLLLVFVIWYLDLGGKAVKLGKQAGKWVQTAAGVLIIFIGVFDIMTFWPL
ncbi:sulfite exporter TauE/SafE family protein [Bacillus daqingensis]|uniref:Sulfite exporter TauE/SafE family protein n=1 Tax=Bacillus daqingensis TaxID=872396 RepID=A0ABV9P2A5_9BACI